MSWPDLPASPYPGECWAIEAELTPKALARTASIMAGLLSRTADYYPDSAPGSGPRYTRVVYLAAPAARGVTERAAASLPPLMAARVTVRDLPAGSGAVSIFWAYLQFRALVWLLRMTGRLLLFAALAAVLVAAAPVTLVAAVGLAGAWLRGWPPARLRRAAVWALPMTAVYLAGRAVQARTWQALALAPVRDYLAAWHAVAAGRVVTAFVLVAPVAVPAGLAAARGLWAWRIYALDTGLSGKTATAPVIFDARQWKRQARAARARITAPGSVPLADRHGRVVMGATIRAVGHRWRPVLAVPYAAMGRHQVVIGASGSGKTNLMIRTWAGWYAAALAAHHQHGAPRPLLVVLDCKGGPDSRAKADRTRRLLHAVGAARVAVWPDETAVSLVGAAAARTGGHVVPDGRDRHRPGRLLRRRDASRPHPRRHRPTRTPGQRHRVPRPPRTRVAGGRLCRGPAPAGRPGQRQTAPGRHRLAVPDPAGPPRPRPRPRRARSPTRTPGTSSWKAPANSRWPKRRPSR